MSTDREKSRSASKPNAESAPSMSDTESLFQLAYGEIYELASSFMSRERASHTLTPTALLNEAYLRIVASRGNQDFQDLQHFAATAATVMRHILVNHAKQKKTRKRGHGWTATSLDVLAEDFEQRSGNLEALHEALEDLGRLDPVQKQLVDLRFFGGQSMQEAAATLGISERTAYYEWSHARAWLRGRVEGMDEVEPSDS